MTDTACATPGCGHTPDTHWDGTGGCAGFMHPCSCTAYTNGEPDPEIDGLVTDGGGYQHRSWCSAVGPDCRCLKIPAPPVPVRGPDEATTDHDQWSESGRSLFCPNERVWTNRDDDDSSCMACGADVPARSPLVVKAADHENDWTATIAPVRGRDQTRGELQALAASWDALADKYAGMSKGRSRSHAQCRQIAKTLSDCSAELRDALRGREDRG